MSVVGVAFSSRRRHTRWNCDWSSDVCSSDLARPEFAQPGELRPPSITHPRDGQGRGSVTRNYASSDGELSPEERLRLAAFREEQQAIASPTDRKSVM